MDILEITIAEEEVTTFEPHDTIVFWLPQHPTYPESNPIARLIPHGPNAMTGYWMEFRGQRTGVSRDIFSVIRSLTERFRRIGLDVEYKGVPRA